MGSSALLVRVVLAVLATQSAVSAASDPAREGAGFRGRKTQAKGTASAEKSRRAAHKRGYNNRNKSLTAALPDTGAGASFPADKETVAVVSNEKMDEAAGESAAVAEVAAPAATLGAGMLPCPPAYDPARPDYAAGDVVEMNSHVFVCQAGEYEPYCGIGQRDPAWDDTSQRLWQNSWYHLEPCQLEILGSTVEEDAAFLTAAEQTESGRRRRRSGSRKEERGEGWRERRRRRRSRRRKKEAAGMAVTATAAVANPDSLYDDQAWGDLPTDVQDAMAILGYTEMLWKGGGKAATDDLDWDELSERERGAATALGYTEALWMMDDGEAPTAIAATAATAAPPTLTDDPTSLSGAPTSAPTAPSDMPTYNPTTPPGMPMYEPATTPPPCPPPFEPQSAYTIGDNVEVDGQVFQCNAAGEGIYERYCNILHWDEALLKEDMHAQELWEDSWVHIGPCGPA